MTLPESDPGRSSLKRLISSLPWVLLLLVVVAWSFAIYFDRGSDELATLTDQIWAFSFFAFPLVGVVLATRLPSNPVGWLFIVGPLLIGMAVAGEEASEALDVLTIQSVLLPAFPVGVVLLTSAILLFPDGRYPNRWWAGLHWLSLLSLPFVPDLAEVFNLVLAVGSMAFRVITGDSTVRRQIAWPIFAGALGLSGFLASLAPIPNPDVIVPLIAFLPLTVGVPVAIAVSILRYRLYDIDRIVSRTVAYLVVLGVLGLIYVTGAVWLPTRLIGEQPPVFVAGATLVAAALFNPLRKKVQQAVDRRFYRSRYDAVEVVDDLAGRLRDQVDPDSLIDNWVDTVTQTLHPARMEVWVRGER